MVIVQIGIQQVGFVVDNLIGQEEVVIKPLDKLLHGTPGMAGATITSDGGIALILDVPNLLKAYAVDALNIENEEHMAVKVLVVNDSSFFRRRVSEIINQDPSLEVIDTAQNGREAVDKALRLQPDVITMDIEMPVMDGISAVREIMAKCPTPILMFSYSS